MPQPASTRLALIGPSGTDGIPLGDDVIRAIITQLEAVGAAFIVGTYASRPTAGAAYKGVLYIASDTGVVSVGTTSSWIEINPKDAAAATASLRTLGTGATQAAAGDHDHDANYQPLDADLTAIAALVTTAFGRSVLTQANAAALRTLAGLVIGTDVQAYDADLAAIAVLSTTTFGRNLLTQADAVALQRAAAIPTVTALPGSPVDGQEIYFVADATNGIVWHLKYRSASASAYKWEFIGGGSLIAQDEAGAVDSYAPSTWRSPGTGTDVAVPLAGQYLCEAQATLAAGAAVSIFMDVTLNGANGASNAFVTAGGAGWGLGLSQTRKITMAATDLVRQVYLHTGGSAQNLTRQAATNKVTPIRVG